MKFDNAFVISFIYPATVAVLASFFGFLGSFMLNRHNSNEEKRLKTIDLVDYLTIQFTSLLVILDKLAKDAENLDYFAFANINLALPVVNKLKSKSDQIILFTDDNLRRQLLEIIDQVSSVIEEVNAIEQYPVSERGKAEIVKADRLKEFRGFSAELLKNGIYINRENNYKPEYLVNEGSIKQPKDQKKMVKAVENLLNDLVEDMNASDDNLKRINTQNEKLRSFLVIRMIDIQTKLRELSNTLAEIKSSLVK